MFTTQSLNKFERLLLMPNIERTRWFIEQQDRASVARARAITSRCRSPRSAPPKWRGAISSRPSRPITSSTIARSLFVGCPKYPMWGVRPNITYCGRSFHRAKLVLAARTRATPGENDYATTATTRRRRCHRSTSRAPRRTKQRAFASTIWSDETDPTS